MLCPNCGSHPSPGDKFCMECGTPGSRFVDDSIPDARTGGMIPQDANQALPPQPVAAISPRSAGPPSQAPAASPAGYQAQQASPMPPVGQRPVDRPPQAPAYAPQQNQPQYQQPYPPATPADAPQYRQPYPPQVQPLPQMITGQRASGEMTPQGHGQIGQYQVYVPPKAPNAEIKLPAAPAQAPPMPAPNPIGQPNSPPHAPPQPVQRPYQPAPPAAPSQPGSWAGQRTPGQPPAQPYQPVPDTYRPYPPPVQQTSGAPPAPLGPQPQFQQPYPPPAPPQSPGPQPVGAPPAGVLLMPQVASAALLRPNERAVQVWRAGLEKDYVNPEDKNDGGTFNINGLLIATDQRLIFVQEKGVFGKSYKPLESMEYREIVNWKLGQTMRMRSLQVDIAQGRDRRKVFNNLSEADPATLNVVHPWTLDQVKQLLGNLRSAAP